MLRSVPLAMNLEIGANRQHSHYEPRVWCSSTEKRPELAQRMRAGNGARGSSENGITIGVHIIAILLLSASPPKFLTRESSLFFSMGI
jgi:hypothetical protein